MILLAVLGVIVAAVILVMTRTRRPKVVPVACPGCASFFECAGVPGHTVRCTQCGVYAQIDRGGGLAPVPSDLVAPAPVFQTYLSEAPRWPAACCVCCAPATRVEPLTVEYGVGLEAHDRLAVTMLSHALGTGRVGDVVSRVTETFGVPHCSQHTGGVQLSYAGVAFRSYRYYNEFVQLNRSMPGGQCASA